MDEERLIENVRKFSFLYDLTHPKYTDTTKKELAWKEISKELKQPAAACKQKWQSLRDCFRRSLNKRKMKSGKLGSKRKKWKYEDEMSYLVPFFAERNSTSLNISTDEEISDGEIERVKIEPDDSTAAADEYGIENYEDQKMFGPSVVMEAHSVEKTPAESPTASAVLMTYLLEEKNKTAAARYDELDHFFLSVSATVKKFSPYERALAKNKIFSLVSEMELQQFARSNVQNSTAASDSSEH